MYIYGKVEPVGSSGFVWWVAAEPGGLVRRALCSVGPAVYENEPVYDSPDSS